MARKDKLDAAFNIITGPAAKEKKQSNRPLGVVLTADQVEELDKIAAELGTNRHKIMQYAMVEFLKRWEAGERPKMKRETKEVLDI